MTKWSETKIAAWLARYTFNRKYLVVVPNCTWTGYECDLLVVTENLRLIDVEIKISRGDLRADIKKDKWYHWWDWNIDGPYTNHAEATERRRRREWPLRVWKHYYAVPAEIWTDELYAAIPEKSGVLLLHMDDGGRLRIEARRGAKPCRDAEPISAANAVDIARLASLRMWAALEAKAA
jgi:Nuclease-related domain